MISLALLITTSLGLMISLSSNMLIPSILLLTLTMMTMKWMQTSNPWISLIFILAFLGGMLIIFMYIISTLSQKKSSSKDKTIFLLLIPMLTFWCSKSHPSFSYPSSMFSSFPTMYWTMCLLITIVLMTTTKIIKSPFKALKGSF